MKHELVKPCRRPPEPISSRCSPTTPTSTTTTRTPRRKSTTRNTILWSVFILLLFSVNRSSHTCTPSVGGIIVVPVVAAAWIGTSIPTPTSKVQRKDNLQRQRCRGVEYTDWSASGRLFLSPQNSAGTKITDTQQVKFGDNNTASSSTTNISFRYCEYSGTFICH
jgi:hypothetical protein